MPHPHRLAAPHLALTQLLTACTGDDGDPSGAPTTAPPSPTATETSEPPVDLSVAPPGETARQFIRRWVALSNQMQESGDTDAYFEVVAQTCESCRKFAGRIEQMYANGGYLRGGAEQVVSMRAESPTQWLVVREAEPAEYANSAQGKSKTFIGGQYKSRVYLAKSDGRWVIGATEGVPL
jgi:hypothetical protein